MLTKSIFYFLILFVLTFFIVKGVESPGLLTIEWFDYTIQVNIIFAIACVLLFVFLVQILMHIMTILGFLPGIIKSKKEHKRLVDGLEKLKQVSLNLSLGNKIAATKFAKAAQKIIPNYPIFDEILDLKSKNDLSNEIIDLKTAKQKVDEFLINFDEEKSLKIVQNILSQHPDSTWAKKKQYDILLKMEEFESAENILNDLYKRKIVSKEQYKLEKSFICYELATLEQDNLNALKLAEQGLKQQPNFIKLIEISVEILTNLGQQEKAIKLITTSARNFNQGLAVFELFNNTISNLDLSEQIKLLNKYSKINPDFAACQIAAAMSLLKQEKPQEAIDLLLTKDLTTKEINLSLAHIYKTIGQQADSIKYLELANCFKPVKANDLIKEYNAWKNNNLQHKPAQDESLTNQVNNNLLLK